LLRGAGTGEREREGVLGICFFNHILLISARIRMILVGEEWDFRGIQDQHVFSLAGAKRTKRD